MKSVIIIPARYSSSRFPGKPLAKINNKTMINRVYSIAKSVDNIDEVFVATDNKEIFDHVESFNGKAVLTDESCQNGTERVYQALKNLNLKPEVIINLQGDTPITPPWIIQDLVEYLVRNPNTDMATIAARLTDTRYKEMLKRKTTGDTRETLVVFNKNHDALYFSNAFIPFPRSEKHNMIAPTFKHIGIYGYSYEFLEKFLLLPPSNLEQTESLEQLRALDNGYKIKVIEVDFKGRTPCSVDHPDDIQIAENIINKEGEIL